MPLGAVKGSTCTPDSNGPGAEYRCSSSSTVTTISLRYRRELRYSRDQQALSDNLLHCTSEPTPTELQIKALEKASDLLKSRVRESRQRLSQLQKRLADSGDGQMPKFTPSERPLEELRLAAVCKEEKLIADQLVQLRQVRLSPSLQPADDPTRGSQMKKNLNLFLQKSPTKRPLLTHSSRPRSVDSLPTGAVPRGRNAVSNAFLCLHYNFHSRSKSLIEGARVGKLRHDVEDGVQQTVPQPSLLNANAAMSSFQIETGMDGELLVPAVDEFTNSFSSRVIAPPQPRTKRKSSLRSLHTSAKPQRCIFFTDFTKVTAVGREYGNVTILPQDLPRPRSDFLGDLSDVPLPSYVQDLMDELEQTYKLSVSLNFSEPDVLTFCKPVPLSPLLELPSPIPPISPLSSSKANGDKPFRKQRSIFSLRLPLRPVLDSASRSTLAASSSTSIFDSTIDQSSTVRSPKSSVALRPRGLPSTRNYDLSLLDSAPDDVPETPVASCPDLQPPPMPKRNRTGPLAALRDVTSRLAHLGRR